MMALSISYSECTFSRDFIAAYRLGFDDRVQYCENDMIRFIDNCFFFKYYGNKFAYLR